MTSAAAHFGTAHPALGGALVNDDGGSLPVAPRAPVPSDAELIARAFADEADAFELLVRRHYRAVFAVALAVLADRADAEDICHDAFVRALARLEDCRQPDRFATWVGAIARNMARNRLAHPSVQRAATLDPRLPSQEVPSSRVLELDELRAHLDAALAELPPLQREVVILHDLHDWPHQTIAEHIGTSLGMSRQHLFKARRRLRLALGPNLLREYFDD